MYAHIWDHGNLGIRDWKKKRESTGNREVRRETRKRRECKTANVFLSMQSAHGLELLLFFFFSRVFPLSVYWLRAVGEKLVGEVWRKGQTVQHLHRASLKRWEANIWIKLSVLKVYKGSQHQGIRRKRQGHGVGSNDIIWTC